jgi:hypothetical protein
MQINVRNEASISLLVVTPCGPEVHDLHLHRSEKLRSQIRRKGCEEVG